MSIYTSARIPVAERYAANYTENKGYTGFKGYHTPKHTPVFFLFECSDDIAYGC
jgi:hypothetical protein